MRRASGPVLMLRAVYDMGTTQFHTSLTPPYSVIIIIFHNDHLFFLRMPEPSHPDGCLLGILIKKEMCLVSQPKQEYMLLYI